MYEQQGEIKAYQSRFGSLLTIFDPASRMTWSSIMWGTESVDPDKDWTAFIGRCKVDFEIDTGIACFCADGDNLWISNSKSTAADLHSAHEDASRSLWEKGTVETPAQRWRSVIYLNYQNAMFSASVVPHGIPPKIRVGRIVHVGSGRRLEIVNDRDEHVYLDLTSDLQLVPSKTK